MNLMVYLRDIPWADRATSEQIRAIHDALVSRSQIMRIEGLKAVVFLRLDSAIPDVRLISRNETGSSQLLAKIVLDAFSSGRDPVEYFHHLLQNQEMPKQVEDASTEIIIFQEVKALRGRIRQEPQLAGVRISDFHKLLLACAKMRKEESIDRLLDRILSMGNVLGTEEYDVLTVLSTYGDDYVISLLDRVNEPTQLSSITQGAKKMLLRALGTRLSAVPVEQIPRVERILSQMDQGADKYLRNDIYSLRQRLKEMKAKNRKS